jgi:hypothetical protein
LASLHQNAPCEAARIAHALPQHAEHGAAQVIVLDKRRLKACVMQIAVQTLDGHRLDVTVDPNGTVKDLRQLLQQQHGLAKCALYFKVKSAGSIISKP